MKRVFILLLFFSLILKKAPAQNHSGDTWKKVKNEGSGTLTVAYYEQHGILYKDANGTMKGVCADILKDFSDFVKTRYNKNLEIRYAIHEENFAGFLKIVKEDATVLGVGNISITEERKKIYKYTPSYMPNLMVMLTHKDAPNITTFNELKDKFPGYTAEVINESTSVNMIGKIKKDYSPSLKIRYMESGPAMLESISNDPKTFGIVDFTEYLNAIRKKIPVKKQNIDLGTSEDLGFLMSKQSDWDEAWNSFLTPEYKKSSKYRQIIATNLGTSFLNQLNK